MQAAVHLRNSGKQHLTQFVMICEDLCYAIQSR